MECTVSVLARHLKVTHNLTEKQITYALKGYSVTPQKLLKQTRLRRINGTAHVDHQNFDSRVHKLKPLIELVICRNTDRALSNIVQSDL